jgi:hypothetical protein
MKLGNWQKLFHACRTVFACQSNDCGAAGKITFEFLNP